MFVLQRALQIMYSWRENDLTFWDQYNVRMMYSIVVTILLHATVLGTVTADSRQRTKKHKMANGERHKQKQTL